MILQQQVSRKQKYTDFSYTDVKLLLGKNILLSLWEIFCNLMETVKKTTGDKIEVKFTTITVINKSKQQIISTETNEHSEETM